MMASMYQDGKWLATEWTDKSGRRGGSLACTGMILRQWSVLVRALRKETRIKGMK